eukprot:1167005-Pleurochrysis_carterae.AAC.1
MYISVSGNDEQRSGNREGRRSVGEGVGWRRRWGGGDESGRGDSLAHLTCYWLAHAVASIFYHARAHYLARACTRSPSSACSPLL